MGCTNPSYVRCTLDPETGSLYWKFHGSARFTDPKDYGNYESLESRGYFDVAVPCRHCLSCHIDYSRNWANRMVLELNDTKCAIFVTLTYDPEHVPLTDRHVMTLCKRDTQLFFKRLRKQFPDKRIRYFLAGEYGPKTLRPHYHAIIFGLSLADFTDLKIVGSNELKQFHYSSPLFESIWSNGYVVMSDVNYLTCAYVSRYCLKKHYKYNKAELLGALPEFTLSSRRPGIGLLNYDKYLSAGDTSISIASSDGVHTFPLPKAIIKKGKLDDNFLDFCQRLDYNRFNRSNERLKSDLLWSEKDYDSYLKQQHKDLLDRIKLLPERK